MSTSKVKVVMRVNSGPLQQNQVVSVDKETADFLIAEGHAVPAQSKD